MEPPERPCSSSQKKKYKVTKHAKGDNSKKVKTYAVDFLTAFDEVDEEDAELRRKKKEKKEKVPAVVVATPSHSMATRSSSRKIQEGSSGGYGARGGEATTTAVPKGNPEWVGIQIKEEEGLDDPPPASSTVAVVPPVTTLGVTLSGGSITGVVTGIKIKEEEVWDDPTPGSSTVAVVPPVTTSGVTFNTVKEETIQVSVPSGSGTGQQSQRLTGFARGLEPEKILARITAGDQPMFWMKWKGVDDLEVDLVPVREANAKCRHLVIAFVKEQARRSNDSAGDRNGSV